MLDNPAKYRVLTPAGRWCSKGFGVGDDVVFGSNVGPAVGSALLSFSSFVI